MRGCSLFGVNMQVYHTITKKLIASGLTQEQIETAPWFDPTIFSISNTGQALPTWEERQATNQRWYFVSGLNLYYQAEGMFHGFLKAAKTLFTAERWEEIYDAFIEHNIPELLLRNEKLKVKRMILRAKDKGMITTEEVQLLNTIFNGS